MAIRKFEVIISRGYIVEVDMGNQKKIDEDNIKLQAMSKFNNDLQFGLISANKDDFACEVKYDWIF